MTQWKLTGPELSGPEDAIILTHDSVGEQEFRIVLGTTYALVEAGQRMAELQHIAEHPEEAVLEKGSFDEAFDAAAQFCEATLRHTDGSGGAGEVVLLLLRNGYMSLEEFGALSDHIRARLEVERQDRVNPPKPRSASTTSGRRASASRRGS